MLFKKKNKGCMTVEQLKKLDGTTLKYVTERDSESGREKKLGDAGAVNIIDNAFTIVCLGKTVFSAPLTEVRAGELMDLSGFTAAYTDQTGARFSIVAKYTDGTVALASRK